MRICLIYPHWTSEYGKIAYFANKTSNFPPLNLANLAAVAELNGHQCQIIDGQIEGKNIEALVAELAADPPDLIGLTATTPFFHHTLRLAECLKATIPEIQIALGGHHITVLGVPAFDQLFDYAFIGEADHSFPAFLKAIEHGEDLSKVKGILFRRDGIVVSTGPADPVIDVDSLPVPARHLLKTERYLLGTMEGTKRYTSISTSRGCPFKCIFCNTNVFGHQLRKRTPEKVVAEMKDVIEKFGVEHFYFLDETLTLDRSHIKQICELIIKESLNITFEGGTRANLVDEGLIVIMRKAGLIRLSFGLEAVDEKIRTTMRKEVPLDSYLVANRLTNRYGIETLNSCMIGLPGETIETICKTLTFLRNSREIKQANVSIAVPYPGTELYRMAKAGEMGLKLLSEDFSNYRRYDAAVMQVGDLTPRDFIQLQNDAIASVCLAPWRWIPIYMRTGLRGLLLTMTRIKNSLLSGQINIIANRPRKKARENNA